MKILLCFPYSDGETGIAIKEGFENLGCKVVAVDAATQATALTMICKKYEGDFDLLLCSRTLPLYEELVKIKKYFPKIKSAIWNPDIRVPIDVWGPMLYMFEFVDFYFDVNEGVVEEFRERWNKNSFFLPQGLHEKRYYPCLPTEAMKMEYSCDVGFIGNFVGGIHAGRRELMEAIVKMQKYTIKNFTNIYGENHNYVVGCSKINLCHSVYPEIKNSYSVRNWKILGAGGVCLDMWREGIEEFFNGYVWTYKGPEDIGKSLDKIMENYDEAKKKADEAVAWARESHTYTHRCEQMLEIIGG